MRTEKVLFPRKQQEFSIRERNSNSTKRVPQRNSNSTKRTPTQLEFFKQREESEKTGKGEKKKRRKKSLQISPKRKGFVSFLFFTQIILLPSFLHLLLINNKTPADKTFALGPIVPIKAFLKCFFVLSVNTQAHFVPLPVLRGFP